MHRVHSFIVNLFLAVVFDEFMRSKASEAAKAELREREAAFHAAEETERSWSTATAAAGAVAGGGGGVLMHGTPVKLDGAVLARTPSSEALAGGFHRLHDETADGGKGGGRGGKGGGGGGGGFAAEDESRRGGMRCLRPLVTSKGFLYVTLGFLIVNVIIMCTPHRASPCIAAVHTCYNPMPRMAHCPSYASHSVH